MKYQSARVMSAGDAVVALDSEGMVVGLNTVAATLLDVDDAAADALTSDLVGDHPELLERLASAEEGASESDVSIETGDERRRYSLSISPALSRTDRPTDRDTQIDRFAVLTTPVDDGERERELDLYRTLVDESPDAFTHIRSDGTMAYVTGTREVVGRTPAEFVDQPLETFIHPDDEKRATAFFEGVLGGEERRVNLRFERGDGSWMWLETTGTPVSNSSAIDGAVTISRDVTERKHREEQLERQNERLDRFASIISHDLRNPLAVASGHAAQAERTGDDAAFRGLQTALERMESMIDTLLVLARSETKIEETEPVSLPDLATAAWETTGTPGAELTIEDARGVEHEADPELLRHVLENLFRNATDHNEAPLTVRVGSVDRDGESVGFYVEDDGRGISQTDRDTVFERGYSTSESGEGFGLAIVREFVDVHGWEIAVTDGAEGGARFEILTE